MFLTSEHIDFITKDLNYRGVVFEGIEEELLDHVCSAVEDRMAQGERFQDAYHNVVQAFGQTHGLLDTQQKVLEVEHQTKSVRMIKNFLTVGLRNVRKQGFYSFINIAGLAVGLAACLVITLFIVDELSYDTYNTKAERIYRVNNEIKFGENYYHITSSSAPTGHALQQDYPEVEAVVRFRNYGSYLVRPEKATESIKEKRVIWTDSSFFRIFSVNVLEGDAKTALAQPASIAISATTAKKYFPNESALGQSLLLDEKYNAKITAVFEDIPQASHFHFDILISMVGDWPVAQEAQSTVFLSNNFQTYVLLKEGASGKALEEKLPGFLDKYVGPQIAQIFGKGFTMKQFEASGNKYNMTLMPILDIHLYSDLKGELEANGSMTYIYLLTVVALFILAIACINFMNLSTARSSNRAKEVGVRKVMGSLRSHLVRQFLTESTLITLFAFVVAIGLAYLILPIFNDLALKQLQIPFANPAFYGALAVGVIVVGLIAGLYPSFFLSAFSPAQVLKGQLAKGTSSGVIRSSLVVFQFIISIFLIIGAITIQRQLAYIQNKKLGFEKNQVLVVHDAYALRPNVQAFKDEIKSMAGVENCTVSGFLPVENSEVSRNDNSFWKEGNTPATENLVSLQDWRVDNDYVQTLGMKMKVGRSFSPEFPSDSGAVVLNEAAAAQFGLGENPIGQRIATFKGSRPDGSPDPNQIKAWTVIGVVENFHFSTMREGITSLGLFLRRSDGFISIRFKGKDAQNIIHEVEKAWKQLAPGQPFQYGFLDDDFGQMYASEQRLAKIFSLFAGLAILIACLGLFALTAFTAEQRTKEIGIRKVLGASVASIVLLLSREFGKLILIAFFLAAPLAWYGVDWWLNRYTYKAEIGVGVYLTAGITAFLVALVTMGYQSIRAASNNPVKSLRSE
jgi:putative ABC transport system permease protein